ncbi:alpha-D-ribose 1-methylphosphonate 5-triphosphate diphosphatase [Shigella sonnei]|nr:alpha-D-ribose 1-methylphosphonate 5-triphosphate diphosphatase [Shigella sonnei]
MANLSGYNFAYLDEQTKRMIRRAILKAVAIPGYQVPFGGREMPMPYGWGTGGIQLTASVIGESDVLKVIDQGADDTTNAVSIRNFFKRVTGVNTTECTDDATLIQTRHRIPETPLTEDQIIIFQVPIPEPLRFIEPRETETRTMHALEEYGVMQVNLEKMINAIEETQKRGVNRAEHRLHLRCELPHHTTLPLFEKLVQREPVTLVSLMDHSPGQRQFANREKYREYYQGKYSLTDAQMQQYEEEQLALAARWSQPNRESIAALCRARKIALASHDDATHAHVAESHQLGSVIAEFPTTFEAAEASRKHGMNVLMGAPNIVRGGSHSGNVAASELAQLGLLDILSSDYYPASLLDAAFRVADDESNRFTLPQAVKLVTKNPAQALNLQDRGVIGEGKRADLVLAHRKGNHIHIDHVWRQGKRVF